MTLAKAQPCLSRKKNRDFRERKKRKRVFSRKKILNFFYRNVKNDRGKPKRRKHPGNRLKSRKRVRKNKKTKSGGSVQSATRGEWLRARQVALIVARLPKERSLTSCSRMCDRVRQLCMERPRAGPVFREALGELVDMGPMS